MRAGTRRGPHPRSLASGIVLAGLLAACTDADPILFPATDQVQVEVTATVEGRAGELLGETLHLRTVDRYGNPVPDVDLVFDVVAGDGAVENPPPRTNRSGEATLPRWRMGPAPGTNTLEVRAGGAEPARVEVTAGPGLPHRLSVEGGRELPDEVVGRTLEDLPVLVLEDRFGTPIPDTLIRVTPSVGGSVGAGEVRTGPDGRVSLPSWSLATQAGPQFLIAGVGTVTARIDVLARPDEATEIRWSEPADLRAVAGLSLPDRLEFNVVDSFGNPVPGERPVRITVSGGGSLVDGSSRVLGDGTLDAGILVLGTSPGTNRVEAEIDGLPTGILEIEAMPEDWDPEGLFFQVGTVHLNQGSQRMDGSIGLVRDRPGLLRVFPLAGRRADAMPPAEIAVFQEGMEVLRSRVEPSGTPVPDMLEPTGLQSSWNLTLPGDLVTGDLEVEVVIDPDEETRVVSRRFHHWPQSGSASGTASPLLEVDELPPYIVRFVSMQDATTGATGRIDEDNFEAFVRDTRRVFPVGQDSLYLGPDFVTNLLSDGRVTTSALTRLWQAWHGSPELRNEFLHGIFPAERASGFSGVAWVNSDPQAPNMRPVAITWDALNSGAGYTVAHELGHNMGQPHAPCGNPSGVDPSFPHPNAQLGVMGYDYLEDRLVTPREHRDLMSYCGPRFISDYNYERVLEWRRASVMGRGGPGVASPPDPEPASGGSVSGLLVSAWDTGGGIHTDPALPVSVPPSPEPASPTHRVRGWDTEGTLLFDHGASVAEISHSPDPSERHVGTVVPVSSRLLQELDRVEVVRAGTPIREAPRVPAPPDPETHPGDGPDADAPPSSPAVQWSRVARLEGGIEEAGAGIRADTPGLLLEAIPGTPAPPTGGSGTLEWDPEVFVQVTIRDPGSGTILGIVDGGLLRLDLWDDPVEFEFSDGVRSWRWGPGGLEPRNE